MIKFDYIIDEDFGNNAQKAKECLLDEIETDNRFKYCNQTNKEQLEDLYKAKPNFFIAYDTDNQTYTFLLGKDFFT